MVSPTFIRCLVALTLAGLLYVVIAFHLEKVATFVTVGIITIEIFETVWKNHQQVQSPKKSVLILLSWNYDLCYFRCHGDLSCLPGKKPQRVILMIAVAQISDILQFIFGKYCGKHHIGWVSPKKTYEGYFIAFVILESVAILLDFTYPSICGSSGCSVDIFSICLLGALGGIFFSLIKRYLQIKDWSSLLGPHGGFLDRKVSLFLPRSILFVYRQVIDVKIYPYLK